MALIKCPECGQEISDKAELCVHCGYPIQEYLQKIEKEKLKENQVCVINGTPVDFSDITPYFTDSCDDDVMLKILLKLQNLENRIAYNDEWELTKNMMITHIVPKEYNATSYDEYIQNLGAKLRNNYECIIHKTKTYDFSPIKEYIDNHKNLDLKCLKQIRNIKELTYTEATYLIEFINKNHLIPFSYPEDITNLIGEKYIQEVIDYWNQKNCPEQQPTPTPQPAQNIPHCPNCNSTNIKRITTGSRMLSGLTFGILSSNIGKTYQCNKCKYKW